MNEFSSNHGQMQTYQLLADCQAIPASEDRDYVGLVNCPVQPQTTLPPLETTFLNSIKKSELQQNHEVDKNLIESSYNISVAMCESYHDSNNNLPNGYPNFNVYQQPSYFQQPADYMRQPHTINYVQSYPLSNQHSAHSPHPHESDNMVLRSYRTPDHFTRTDKPIRDTVASKSSLSSLESLASSISAVPILDPEFFNLAKDRKCGGKSGKVVKGKSPHGKRRKTVGRIESELTQSSEKEINLQSCKTMMVKKEPFSTDITHFSLLQKQDSISDTMTYLDSNSQNGFNGQQADKLTNVWYGPISSNSEVTADLPESHLKTPPALLHLNSNECKQELEEAAVFTDLNKIVPSATKCKHSYSFMFFDINYGYKK